MTHENAGLSSMDDSEKRAHPPRSPSADIKRRRDGTLRRPSQRDVGKVGEARKRRANDLEGREWTRNSISVWSDLKRDSEESTLKHPAIYPKALVSRLLDCFTTSEDQTVLDPFSGSGSTLLAAWLRGKAGVGFEINPEYVNLTRTRQESLQVEKSIPGGEIKLFGQDARALPEKLKPGSVDICITSPPYWDILTQRRTADSKSIRHYGEMDEDLGRIKDYDEFLAALTEVFTGVLRALRPGGYCLVNVMDLRKGPHFYPLHSDLAKEMQAGGWTWDDLIIWDRRLEYNHMRPLGYPAVFRINKAHEYILVMQRREETNG